MKNIMVMALEPFNLELLRTIEGDDYRFYALFDYEEVVHSPEEGYPSLDALVDRAMERFEQQSGGVDAVMGYWDFPTSVVVPMIRQRMGMPGASLEAVARCEHKYWSRLVQREVIPEHLPPFQALDPFADDPLDDIEISYPFWIKPVKAHSSFLGFHIEDAQTLREHLPQIREKIGLLGERFNEFLAHVEQPEEVASIDGNHCIAEEIIAAGHQCTVEGYCWQGEVEFLGIVDSVRSGRHRSSFTRYQYPSHLPQGVQERMADLSRRVMQRLDYDGAAFNIEYFWDPERDTIRLLEINSRISKSHSPLFLMVDGATNQQAILHLALGRRPEMPLREGPHKLAAKFMLRYFEDGILERVPTDTDIARLHERFPESRIRLVAEQGDRLGELKLQDSYSYEVAEIFLGADREEDLLERYREACEILDFRVRPTEDAEP